MSINYGVREVYKKGIVRPENKYYEAKCFCNCYRCKNMYSPRTLPNVAYAYVYDEKDIEKAIEFLKNWNCGGSKKDLPNQYYHIDCDGNFKL